MNLSRKYFVAATVIGSLFASVQAQEIATWAGFRQGAASFTFDDGAPSHVTDAAPVFDKYGYKGTFNLVTTWNPNWSGFQGMADNGHEIASHSDNHGNPMPDNESASSRNTINGKISQNYGVVTLAYPNCKSPSASSVSQNYVVGRICNGSWQGVPDISGKDGPSDWTKVPATMTGSEGDIKSTNDFTGQMQKAIQQGGWVSFLTHGFQGKSNGYATYSPTDLSAIDGALSWAKQNDSKIWVAPMGHVAMYIKERKAAKITEKSSSATSMSYTLTHSIADNISKYNYPLSIRVKSSWTKVSATQDGKAIEASIKDGYIYFDAVPNGGDIVLSSDGAAVVDPGSSTSTEPSSSASAEGNPFKGAIEIPGTVEAENYDVNAYSHSQAKNDGTAYRTDDDGVVVAGAGYAAGYTTAGDYYEYTIDVKAAGKYKVTVNGATGNGADGSVTVSVGTATLDAAIKNMGDWNTYTEVEAGELELAAGKQILRLTINDNNLNVDWIKFEGNGELVKIANTILMDAGAGLIKCQIFDMNGQLVKSANVFAGSAQEAWKGINGTLRNGAYVMRYGVAGKATQTIRVRK